MKVMNKKTVGVDRVVEEVRPKKGDQMSSRDVNRVNMRSGCLDLCYMQRIALELTLSMTMRCSARSADLYVGLGRRHIVCEMIMAGLSAGLIGYGWRDAERGK